MMKYLLLFIFLPIMLYPHEKRIAIIGAGLAGLTAAFELQKQGHRVVVYEARNRVGGRVHTLQTEVFFAELGGLSISDGGDASHFLNLCQELEVAIQDVNISASRAFFPYDTSENAISLIENLAEPDENMWHTLQHIAENSASFEDVLNIFFQNQPELKLFFSVRIRNWEGSDPCDLSTHYITTLYEMLQTEKVTYEATKNGQDPRYCYKIVAGGNQYLLEALTKQLKHPVYLNHELKKADKTSTGQWLLSFKNGHSDICDIVIFAIPCSVLKTIEFPPHVIPKDQWEAICELPYGSNAKIVLPIILKDPPSFEFYLTPQLVAWFNPGYRSVTFYFGGREGCFEKDTIEQILNKELKRLKQLHPGVQIGQPTILSWIKEPFSKGSYSNWGNKNYEKYQELVDYAGVTFRKCFRPIEGNCFFIGEHTALKNPSTMEGAINSAQYSALALQLLLQ